MYIYSKNVAVRHVPARNTHTTDKFVFKVESKIGTKYENSPCYRGTKIWNSLLREVQFSDNKWVFKTHIAKLYKEYKSDL